MAKKSERFVYIALQDCTVNTAANGQLFCKGTKSITKSTVVESPVPFPAELTEVTHQRSGAARRPKFGRLTEAQVESPDIGGRALLRQVVV